MDELTQILSHEEKNRGLVEKEREKAKQELQDKKEKIAEILETNSALTAEEKSEVLAEEKRELKKIEEEKKKELDLKLSKLDENKEEKIQLAVNYIIKNSFRD